MASRAQEMAPSLATSFVLHVAVLLAALIVWPRQPPRPIELATSVPVNIVPNAPTTNIRPAVQAEEPVEAQAEDPEPVPPAIVAPREELHPAPPVPRPVPIPRPTPPAQHAPAPKLTPTPTPQTTQSRRPASERPDAPSDDFIRNLERTLAQSPPTAGRPATGGRRGPPRPPADPTPAPDAGDGFSVAEQNQFRQRLMELWNPNCAGAGAIPVRIRVRITAEGRLDGRPAFADLPNGPTAFDDMEPTQAANARRAISAFFQAERLRYLPVNLPDGDLLITFDPSNVCRGR